MTSAYSTFFLLGLSQLPRSAPAATTTTPCAASDVASLYSTSATRSRRNGNWSFLSLDHPDTPSFPSSNEVPLSAPAYRASFLSTSTSSSASLHPSVSRRTMHAGPGPMSAPSCALPPLPTPRISIDIANLPSISTRPDSPTLRATPVRSRPRTSSVSSIASTVARMANRSDALACLEGRSNDHHRISRATSRKNFMSMSDDEDEDEQDELGDGDSDSESSGSDDLFELEPKETPTASSHPFLNTAPSFSPSSPRPSNGHVSSPVLTQAASRLIRPRPRRPRTADTWFTSRLSNFIELGDEESSITTSPTASTPTWRSFVEIMA